MSFFAPTSSGNAVKFATPGDKFRGTVAGAPDVKQRIDPRTKQPLAYDDGNPKMQAIIPFTGADGNDYRLFVPAYSRLQKAIKAAVGQAGLNDLAIGVELEITYTRNGVGQGSIPPKEFDVSVVSVAPVPRPTPVGAAPAAAADDEYEAAPVDPWAGNDDF